MLKNSYYIPADYYNILFSSIETADSMFGAMPISELMQWSGVCASENFLGMVHAPC